MADAQRANLPIRSEEHTSELKSPCNVVCRLLLEKKKSIKQGHEVGGGESYKPHHQSSREYAKSKQRFRQGFLIRNAGRQERAQADFFFFNDTATTEIYTLSLHDALPI